MSVPLRGRCIVGGKEQVFRFDNWLPVEIPEILFGINPSLSALERLIIPGCTMCSYDWNYEGHTYNLCFVPPEGACIQPLKEWGSKSSGSWSLYPWWYSIGGDNGTPPVDLVCQIHPRGSSSEHRHAKEDGIEVAEEYGPVLNDGKTMLRIENEELKPLLSLQRILADQSHQLIREVPGFSIHLLLMRSHRFRFPDRGGHIPCSRSSR